MKSRLVFVAGRKALRLCVVFWLACLAGAGLFGGTTSSTDGSTPAGLAPGAPLGSYPLNGFEQINLYNGGLNFKLDLLHVGGRGEARATVVLPIELKWRVQHVTVPNQSGPPSHFYYPSYDWWTIRRSYSPGLLTGRYSGEGIGCGIYTNVWIRGLSRLTFTDVNGTEYDLRDQLTDGEPSPTCTFVTQGKNRGKIFVSSDGTAATFTSDTDILDSVNPDLTTFSPSGVLATRDGIRYRIDQGTVTWMRDANGNKISFTYDGLKRVLSITDSINRLYSFTYGANQDTITFKTAGGQTQTINVHYEPLANLLRTGSTLQTFQQLFPGLNGSTQQSNPVLVSRAVLPNSQEYRFRYNSYGELARVELPTGGVIEYDHDGGAATGSGVITKGSVPDEKAVYRRLMERREYPDGSARVLRTSYLRPANTSPTVAVVDHFDAGNARITRERHTFEGRPAPTFFKAANSYPAWKEGRETMTERYDTNATTLLRSSDFTWTQGGTVAWWTGSADTAPPANPRLTQQRNWVVDNSQNLVAQTNYSYDQYNNVTDIYEYDFGTGSAPAYATRRTRTTYVTTNLVGTTTYNYDTTFSIHIRDLPKERWVYNVNPSTGAETLVAQTRYNYDRYDATTNHAALISRTGLAGFDSTFTTTYKTRGNATSVDRWLNTNSSWVTNWAQYDIAGNVVKTIDPRSNATTYEFTDVFGSPDGEARTNTNPSELGSLKAFAFVTQSVNPLTHRSYSQYDYWSGLPVDVEDPNGNLRSMTYDRLGRLIREVRPDGGVADTYYSDLDLNAVRQGANVFLSRTSSNPLRRKTYTSIDTGLENVDLTVFDGMGRPSMTGGSNNTKLDWTRREYHALFGTYRVSNPVSLVATTEIPTAGSFTRWTSLAYDALGRVTTETTQDGQTIGSAYFGNRTTVTDQLGNPLRSFTDGLGRLSSVVEPNPSNAQFDTSSLTTSYEWDAGDRLTRVTQGSQQRVYAYDTLGRLTQETIPEWGTANSASGSATYAYDPASNLTSRTDARSVTVTWGGYDALNRPASKTYSDTTPRVDFFYDSASTPNGKGRLTSMTDGAGSESYQYNSMGQLSRMVRSTTGGPTLTGDYVYNLAGGLKRAAYPGVLDGTQALTVVWEYDNAGRQISALWDNGSTAFQRMVNNYTFDRTSTGGTEQTTYANNTTETVVYNERLQPTSRTIPGVMSLTYSFGRSSDGKNNGNVHQIVDGQVSGWNFTYTYDALNRILTSTGPGSTLINFSIDRWGNKSQTSTAGPNKPLSFTTNGYDKNRISTTGYSYDNAGNMLGEPLDNWTGRGAMTYTYDAESRVKTASGAAAASYFYDGNGRRVKEVTGGQTRYIYYDPFGNAVWEYASNLWETYNLYFNGRLVFTNTAVMSPSKVWLGLDHLGTPRVKINEQGLLIPGTRLYYHPYGERANAKTDPVKYEFTGKERDSDTNLDYFGARYYGSAQGRFTTTDPLLSSGRPDNPQSWNRYAYTLNNPLRYADPTGLYEWDASLGGACTDKALKSGSCAGFSKSEGKDIVKARKQIRKQLKRLEKSRDSLLQAAVAGIGKENVDNGVTVAMGAVEPGAEAQLATAKPMTIDSNGNPELKITVKPGAKGDSLFMQLAHEGNHASEAQAVANGTLPVVWHIETELRSYLVNVAAAKSLGWSSVGPPNGPPFWSASWSRLDQQTRPPKEIIKFLLSSPNYQPKNFKTAYVRKSP